MAGNLSERTQQEMFAGALVLVRDGYAIKAEKGVALIKKICPGWYVTVNPLQEQQSGPWFFEVVLQQASRTNIHKTITFIEPADSNFPSDELITKVALVAG